MLQKGGSEAARIGLSCSFFARRLSNMYARLYTLRRLQPLLKGPLLGQNLLRMTESGRVALLDCGVQQRCADSALTAQGKKI